MDKYLNEKVNRYKTNLYIAYVGLLTVMLVGYTFYSIYLENNYVDGFKIFGAPVNEITMFSMKSGWFVVTSMGAALIGIGCIYVYYEMIVKRISITYEDFVIPVNNNVLALYNLLNKKVLIDPNNDLEINIENFPDANIDIFKDVDNISSIKIRKYKFNGVSKDLEKLGLDNKKEYNCIVSINLGDN